MASSTLARAYLASVRLIREAIDADALLGALSRNDVASVRQLAAGAARSRPFRPLERAMQDEVLRHGRAATAKVAAELAKAQASVVAKRFDPFAESTRSTVKSWIDGLVAGLVAEVSAIAGDVAARGLSLGRNADRVARDVSGSIGLGRRQVAGADAYRQGLETADRSALRAALRNPRTDPTVLRAVAAKAALPPGYVDDRVAEYLATALRHRGAAVAANEAVRAASIADFEAWTQAVAEGAVAASAVRKFWVARQDRGAREGHGAIAAMFPDGLPLDGVFVNPATGALLRFPHDPAAPVAETAGCRCSLIVDVAKST